MKGGIYDFSSKRGQEYLEQQIRRLEQIRLEQMQTIDENVCLHLISGIPSLPYDLHLLSPHSVDVEDWEVINSNEDVLVTISCRKCGERQQQTLCLQSMLEDLNLEWNE